MLTTTGVLHCLDTMAVSLSILKHNIHFFSDTLVIVFQVTKSFKGVVAMVLKTISQYIKFKKNPASSKGCMLFVSNWYFK